MLLFLAAMASAGDTGLATTPVEMTEPVTPIVECEFFFLTSETELVGSDPLNVDPCGEFDASYLDPTTGECAFSCPGISDFVVML